VYAGLNSGAAGAGAAWGAGVDLCLTWACCGTGEVQARAAGHEARAPARAAAGPLHPNHTTLYTLVHASSESLDSLHRWTARWARSRPLHRAPSPAPRGAALTVGPRSDLAAQQRLCSSIPPPLGGRRCSREGVRGGPSQQCLPRSGAGTAGRAGAAETRTRRRGTMPSSRGGA